MRAERKRRQHNTPSERTLRRIVDSAARRHWRAHCRQDDDTGNQPSGAGATGGGFWMADCGSGYFLEARMPATRDRTAFGGLGACVAAGPTRIHVHPFFSLGAFGTNRGGRRKPVRAPETALWGPTRGALHPVRESFCPRAANPYPPRAGPGRTVPNPASSERIRAHPLRGAGYRPRQPSVGPATRAPIVGQRPGTGARLS